MKATVPLPLMITLIGAAIAIAFAIWTIRTDVQLMNQRMDFEAQLRESDKETFMQAFKAMEAKIDAARNGSAALSSMQDNERLRQELSKLRGR
jgi:hypothetical protein